MSRLPYWMLNLVVLALLIAPLYIEHSYTEEQIDIYKNLIYLFTIWPLLAMQVKRWRDKNKTGWWVLKFCPRYWIL